MVEQVAVMKDVAYGRWGMHEAGLHFETWLTDGSATLQLLFGKRAALVMAQAGVGSSDVHGMEGRSCLVDVDGYHVTFKRLVPAPAR